MACRSLYTQCGSRLCRTQRYGLREYDHQRTALSCRELRPTLEHLGQRFHLIYAMKHDVVWVKTTVTRGLDVHGESIDYSTFLYGCHTHRTGTSPPAVGCLEIYCYPAIADIKVKVPRQIHIHLGIYLYSITSAR